ncbi:transporter [Saccharopolyspora sp. CA-218241]|uniref:PH-like domain-containing protein n=1 Tax=Saccharopolyspora sp. CA-218241 TaxID=3240027 RepID=UPI003D971672
MDRLIWVLLTIVLIALVFWAMRRGWVNRVRRQQAVLAEFPAPPAELGTVELRPAMTGMYVGTTRAPDWQDRIAVGDIGHRSEGVARLHPSGLLLERTGATALWIPAESIVDARRDHKLANKVVPGAGLLVVRWRLGETELDTGFRFDDKAEHEPWAEAVRGLGPASVAAHDTTANSRQEDE